MVHESGRDFESGQFLASRAVDPPEAGIQLLQANSPGSFTSPDIALPQHFLSVVLSANFSTGSPDSLGVVGLVATRSGEDWSPWYRLLRWGATAPDMGEIKNDTGHVEVDVLRFTAPAREVRYSIAWQSSDPACRLRRVALSFQGHHEIGQARASGPSGLPLDVPFLSQWDVSRHPPGSVCSPTCLAMVAHYYGVNLSPDQIADLTFDANHDIYGNWSTNMLGMSLCGFRALVEHASGPHVLDAALEERQPLITSIAFGEQQLTGAPIPRTKGHLVVVAGKTERGDYLVRDPAARGRDDWRQYPRAEFERAWLGHGGVFYRITPEGKP